MLADKIVNGGDYAREAAEMLRKWPPSNDEAQVDARLRAERIAHVAAEEIIRTEGIQGIAPDEYLFFADRLASDDHLRDCIDHMCWHGLAVQFEGCDGASEQVIVSLGDYTLEGLAA